MSGPSALPQVRTICPACGRQVKKVYRSEEDHPLGRCHKCQTVLVKHAVVRRTSHRRMKGAA
jgi:uncharacterized Zn finger protein